MNKCDKYHVHHTTHYTYDSITGKPIPHLSPVGVCWGTKEQDECSCEGNRCNCDFYETVRKEAKQRELEISIPTRISDLIIQINGLDLSGFEWEEAKRAKIIDELFDIKTIFERRNT